MIVFITNPGSLSYHPFSSSLELISSILKKSVNIKIADHVFDEVMQFRWTLKEIGLIKESKVRGLTCRI